MEGIEGSIVLDNRFALTRDQTGRVRIEPWNCHLPKRRAAKSGGRQPGPAKAAPASNVLSQEEIDALLSGPENDGE